jgi:hypothetical protein
VKAVCKLWTTLKKEVFYITVIFVVFQQYIGIYKPHFLLDPIHSFTYLFRQYWGLNSGLPTCKEDPLQLEHASGPFFSGYLGDRVLLLAQVSLDHKPPILYFPLELK